MNLKWNTAILVCLLLFKKNFINAGSHLRIFGGKEASIEDHPWIVSLQNENLGHLCGGSLISEEWVLTAATCFLNKRYPVSVIAGTSNLTSANTTIKLDIVEVHEKFRPQRIFDYDIALVKVAEKVTFSDKIQPISLPDQDAEIRVGTQLTVAGWGFTKMPPRPRPYNLEKRKLLSGPASYSDVLMETNVTVVRHCPCMKTIIAAIDKTSGICKGDAGGPLHLNGTLLGIASGIFHICESHYPATYTNVALFRTWIKENAGI
ncbi:trypsin 5G1 isoform X3 [Diabrotica virgifera virgifera]|uniref:trypsin n=1 Tax=Diabrotica virgifera virgifera TaxID=50390 RepID=A0ABM5KEN8_DIAVI|nr:trypsin 5G1 isoform X3 [Diabrotica virgifera virgifera]